MIIFLIVNIFRLPGSKELILVGFAVFNGTILLSYLNDFLPSFLSSYTMITIFPSYFMLSVSGRASCNLL